MILQVDHVALSSIDFKTDISFWEKLGYKLQFTEENLKNIESKKEFLTFFQETHKAALLSKKLNFSVELLNHGRINFNRSIFVPIIQNIPEDLIKKGLNHEKIANYDLKHIIMKRLNIDGFLLEKDENKSIILNKMLIRVSDIQASVKFWLLLGFKKEIEERDGVLLKFQSIFGPETYYIILHSLGSTKSKEIYIDDHGFNCIAFVSNNAQNEKKILKQNNYYTSKIEQLEVNGTLFDLFFARGPSYELIEILSPYQK